MIPLQLIAPHNAATFSSNSSRRDLVYSFSKSCHCAAVPSWFVFCYYSTEPPISYYPRCNVAFSPPTFFVATLPYLFPTPFTLIAMPPHGNPLAETSFSVSSIRAATMPCQICTAHHRPLCTSHPPAEETRP
ncbi:uncharacterized protein DS421_3g103050 [Arachis hypogaea]|nr:uncharacterized protein DS421_3g103050 [Arachis hypogaea]